MNVKAIPVSLHRARSIGLTAVPLAALCLTFTYYKSVYATEAIVIGGGSNMHNASVRFETTVDWLQSVLDGQNVEASTYYNDGNQPGKDTPYQTNESLTALVRVFGQTNPSDIRYREQQLSKVHGSTDLQALQPAIENELSADTEEELLLISIGIGSSNSNNNNNSNSNSNSNNNNNNNNNNNSNNDGNGDTAPENPDNTTSLRLWNDTRLSATQLHELVHQHDRPFRYVVAQDYAGGFHRLAYKDPINGITLGDKRHCGFTSTTEHGTSETSILSSGATSYDDYAAVFFSALHGYELDGEIVSRFTDSNKDGVTSLREAHLYTLEEARSIELSLSSSEDYLMRWQPWYLRWQPASKQLPNNEYSRIFRDLASTFELSLQGNVAREIRQRLNSIRAELNAMQLQDISRLQRIEHLQASLKSYAISQWPALAKPYSKGYEQLVSEGQLAAIDASLSHNQPDYDELVDLQNQIDPARMLMQDKQREATQYDKLLQLRHLALLKQQLYDHGKPENISDYRSLVQCEEAPLNASADYPVLSEDTTQVR